VDWHELDPEALFATVREDTGPADAERTVWAFEQALAAARIDPGLLDHLAAAAVCALAYRDGTTPRLVAEQLFRRAVTDESWRARYAQLLEAVGE